MTTLRIYLAELWLQLSRWCAQIAIDVLPDEEPELQVEIPLVLPPPYEPTIYAPTLMERQCALFVEQYGYAILLANRTACAVPVREQEGRC